MAALPKVLLLVSGGADSVFLFWQFLAAKQNQALEFAVLHFNHHLRGLESDADADFVQNLCISNEIEYIGVDLHFAQKIGIQNEARQLRYQRACEIAKTKGYAILATAHHADDQIETLTMRKARGAGLKGLCGIHTLSTSHGLKLWRPILHWRKSEILQKLALEGRLFRTDSSNSSLAYFRNRTRQALEALAPDDKWYNQCETHRLFLTTVDAYFNKRMKAEGKAQTPFIPKAQFNRLTTEMQFRLLQHRAKHCGLKKQWRLQDFLQIQKENQILNLGPLVLVHDSRGLWFLKNSAKHSHSPMRQISKPGAYYWGQKRLKVIVKEIELKYLINKNNFNKTEFVVRLTTFPWQVASNVLSNAFWAFGRTTSGTVQAFLKDQKVNRWIRPHWPIILGSAGEVVAVLGIEIDNAVRVNSSDAVALTIKSVWPR